MSILSRSLKHLPNAQKNKAPDSQTSQATCQTKEIDRVHCSHSAREAKQNETNKKNQGSPIKTIKSHDSILVISYKMESVLLLFKEKSERA